MRIGILVECGYDGLEDIFVRRVCQLLRAEAGEPLTVEMVPMDNKAQLIRECGPAVAGLLESGCDQVVILWDQRPAWPKSGEPLCWLNDRRDILANLQTAGLEDYPIGLVCIEREFESWLLFDEKMLQCVLCTPEHPRLRISPPRNPDTNRNPKGAMMSLFKQHGKRYVDVDFAKRLANCLTALNRLRRCKTFKSKKREGVSSIPNTRSTSDIV